MRIMITYGTAAAVTANFAGALLLHPICDSGCAHGQLDKPADDPAFSSTSASTKYLFSKTLSSVGM